MSWTAAQTHCPQDRHQHVKHHYPPWCCYRICLMWVKTTELNSLHEHAGVRILSYRGFKVWFVSTSVSKPSPLRQCPDSSHYPQREFKQTATIAVCACHSRRRPADPKVQQESKLFIAIDFSTQPPRLLHPVYGERGGVGLPRLQTLQLPVMLRVFRLLPLQLASVSWRRSLCQQGDSQGPGGEMKDDHEARGTAASFEVRSVGCHPPLTTPVTSRIQSRLTRG